MSEYRLSNAADLDLTDIYTYTFEKFGAIQADSYFDALETSLIRLANNPALGKEISDIRPGYRRFIHQRHAVYYQSFSDHILIVRVLGPGMSFEKHLP